MQARQHQHENRSERETNLVGVAIKEADVVDALIELGRRAHGHVVANLNCDVMERQSIRNTRVQASKQQHKRRGGADAQRNVLSQNSAPPERRSPSR